MSSNPESGHGSCSPDADIVIGKIVSVNVPRRELRIAPDTSHPERFRVLHQLRLQTREGKTVVLPVVSVRVTNTVVIAKIDSQDDEEVAAARGALILIRRSERFRLPPDEYYIDDLIGLLVKDTAGRVVGRVAEVWQTAANDIYQVLDEEGRETLLPAIEDVIIKIDVGRGEMLADTSLLE